MKAVKTRKDIAPFDAEIIGTVSERKQCDLLSVIYSLKKRKIQEKVLIFTGKRK